MSAIGTADGDRCNRLNGDGFECDGTMCLPIGENCSCHICPPCSSCLEASPTCDVCQATGEDE